MMNEKVILLIFEVFLRSYFLNFEKMVSFFKVLSTYTKGFENPYYTNVINTINKII